MTPKIIAARALPARPAKRQSFGKSTQRGVTLIELMVGLVIGLLTIGVAMAALMVSRGISGTVSDASSVQQQAAYAMRVIGLQLRQAGSLYLNLNPGTAPAETEFMAPVGLEAKTNGFDPAKDTLSVTGSAYTVGYRRYTEPVYTDATAQALSRNCLGGPANTSTDQRIENVFELVDSQLMCGGNGAVAQPIVRNVAEFQVRYLLQDNAAAGDTKIAYATSIPAGDESKVQAVEVCMVLYGDEAIDLPSGSEYTRCDGTTKEDMSTLTGIRAKRMHMTFRNVFQLRSQGLIGSVL